MKKLDRDELEPVSGGSNIHMGYRNTRCPVCGWELVEMIYDSKTEKYKVVCKYCGKETEVTPGKAEEKGMLRMF
ncbi:MAG: hypothetical protein Q4D81_09995 [Eubacteriales bacterium]|nr:hypothetical protein [Eubacteriales bacterium]